MNVFLIPKEHNLLLPWKWRSKSGYKHVITDDSSDYQDYNAYDFHFPEKYPVGFSVPPSPRPTNLTSVVDVDSLQNVENMADVLLMPSPGEHFWLKIDCLDIWLHRINAELTVKVKRELKSLNLQLQH